VPSTRWTITAGKVKPPRPCEAKAFTGKLTRIVSGKAACLQTARGRAKVHLNMGMNLAAKLAILADAAKYATANSRLG